MSKAEHGNPLIDKKYVINEREFFKSVDFKVFRNLGFAIVSKSASKFFYAFKKIEPFVYEKFIQSSIRAKNFKNMSKKEFIDTYGEVVAYSVFKYAKEHQKPKYLLN